jgi:protein TonB
MVALRVPAAMSTGLLVTVGLFALLWSLVDAPNLGEPIPTVPFPNFTHLREPPPSAPPVRPPPPVFESPVLPPGPTGPDFSDPGIVRPGRGERIPLPTFGTEIPAETSSLGSDHDPQPIVRVDPDYPFRAIRDEIEGWVEVQFSVTATGAVKDVIIIDSHPKSIFDAAVLKAVGRWRYNPKVDNGVAVERVGVRTIIRFVLEHG